MTDDDLKRLSVIAAELRSSELVLALRHAVSGSAHWRLEAQNLLTLVDGGVMPQRYEPHHTQEAA